ncbi:ricin-type beta-trefoil lectin domain protein [Hahella aquimaris]|uniref:ricin-type beta-trefoil lectin domain protein n=1 Tax=Hahella sp. HNIBRBA332 TaxID=3015983 RepID=UPI00273A8489|nr:ricin-type beta-trefoil lectin domain protein [Hahella sp. HNIBRBA332]WLQ12915.1 ricin-type beta-trefoil lectin domain protein [Hahella sp. HNIBRBA332]
MTTLRRTLTLTLLTTLLAACSDGPKVSQDAKVIEDAGALRPETVGSSEMVFESEQAVADVKPGSVIVSGASDNAPYGFLKRVKSKTEEDGATVLSVEDAQLTDVVEEADVSLSGALNPSASPTPRLAAKGLDLSARGITVYSPGESADLPDACADKDFRVAFEATEAAPYVTVTGCVGFSSNFIFDLEIEHFQATRAEFVVDSKIGSALALKSDVELASINQKTELARFDVDPINFQIGPIPVVIVPEIVLVMGVDGKVDVNVDISASHELSAQVGLLYADNRWSTVNESQQKFDTPLPQGDGAANARVYAGPEMEFMFYGVAGPGANIYVFSRMNADVDALNPAKSNYELWAGAQAGASFRVEVFDKTLFKIHESNLIGYEGLIASSEYDGLAPPGTGRVIGVIGDAMQGKLVSGDDIIRDNLSGELVDLLKGLAANEDDSDGGYTVAEANARPRWRELKIAGRCLQPDYVGHLAMIRPVACDGGDKQKWWWDTNGAVHPKANAKLCIDGLGVTPGVNLALWGCHGGDNQEWAFEDGRMRNKRSESLFVTYEKDIFNWLDYAQLKSLKENTDKQFAQWGQEERVNGVAASHFRPLKSARSGLCLGVQTGSSSPELQTCGNASQQHWFYDSVARTLYNAAGDCLSHHGENYNGATLFVETCSTSSNQTFDFADGAIRTTSDAAIVVDAYGSEEGAVVGQWMFHDGANQLWLWGE